MNRRRFLPRTGAVAGGAMVFPYFVPSCALGLDGALAPGNRITVGLIGADDRGMHVMKNEFIPNGKAQVRAVCDAFKPRVKGAMDAIDNACGTKGCTGHADFRELVANKSMDAVFITTPGHWHVSASNYGARAGKDSPARSRSRSLWRRGKRCVRL